MTTVRMTTIRNRSRPFSLLVAVLAVCLFAAVGFRVGQSAQSSTAAAASTWQNAASAAYSPAKAQAYRVAWRNGYERGWRSGAAAGTAAGAAAGLAAARPLASARTVLAAEVAATLAATPIRLAPGARTERCIVVAGGVCEALGPRITGRSCPAGSRADPEGGVVCVPDVLLLAGRVAGAGSAKLFAP